MSRAHGSLTLMLSLSFSTGILDAATYLGLHGVFTANMTGNLIFIGLGVAGESDVLLVRASLALAGFATGAAVTGRLQRNRRSTGSLESFTAIGIGAVGFILTVCALVLCFANRSQTVLDGLTCVMAFAMGAQAMIARRVGVPDVNTVVVTSTLAGLMGDNYFAGRSASARISGKRLLAVLTMGAGAALGAVILQWSLVGAVGASAAINVSAAGVAGVLGRVRPTPSENPTEAGRLHS